MILVEGFFRRHFDPLFLWENLHDVFNFVSCPFEKFEGDSEETEEQEVEEDVD